MYRLDPAEPVPEAIRRIVVEETADAIKQLGDSAGNRDKAVHEARKSVKKLRALLRLVRSELGPVAAEENARLRNVGRQLSELRDAAAMLEVIDDLKKQSTSEIKGLAGIRRHLLARKRETESRPDITGIIQAATAAFDTLASHARSWPPATDGFSALEKGFKRTLRAGRKALARVKKHTDDENYHELRKRVKDHWYHTRLLSGVLGKDIERREEQLEHLSEWLGDDHNMVVLRAMILQQPRLFRTREDMNAFLDLLKERQAQLRANALRQGTRLYAPKPRRLARRMERSWIAAKANTTPAPGRKPPGSHREVTTAAVA